MNEDNRDLIALYERGEITAEEFANSVSGDEDLPKGLKPFVNKDERVFLSLNVIEKDDESVMFRIGLQHYFGIELLGARNQVTSEGARTRQGTNCKYRALNGVTLVSMTGPLEWCPDGYYYALAKADHLGESEIEIDGLFIIDEKDESKELMPAGMAAAYRKFYDGLEGSTTYDPKRHNQVVRGRVLKLPGPDKRNVEIKVSPDDFEAIEFAVRAYNKYMNDNVSIGEFSEHVMKMMDMSRMLPTGE